MKTAEEIRATMENLTLEEKISLCQGATFWETKGIREKGIPEITVSDGPHGLRRQTEEVDHLGVNKSIPATCFPSAASLACSWDENLAEEVGKALGEECLQEQVSVLLGPGVNIKRSPLCGRNFEYYSEDPWLSSHMAAGHIRGVQSKGVGCCLKHFALNNQETCRMTVNAVADERTLREIYLASFETAVKEAKPWSVMSAYNRVNGEFCSENHHLLREILREEWGYEGVVISDWGAVNNQAKGIEEGFDLRMPCAGEKKEKRLLQAVRSGKVSEKRLDETVERILKMVFRGEENRREYFRYDAKAHHALAVRAACESAVLLKNDRDVLPLKREEKIAVIGGFAFRMRYQGGGSSHVIPTVRREFPGVMAEDYPDVAVSFFRGYRRNRDEPDAVYVAEAVEAVKKADKAVVFLGLPDTWESEGFDRKHLRLPDNQVDLLKRIRQTGTPVAVVLFSGAPVETPWIGDADALLAMYTAGQGAAEAAARLLFGDANPCGKLAETWPLSLAHTPCSLNYPQREEAVYNEGMFVGYRYYEKKELPVRFSFGYGLSYTSWSYDHLRINRAQAKDTEEILVTLDVTNTGAVSGKEIVQLYVRDTVSSVPRPVKELKGMAKVSCAPGERKQVSFTLDKRSFAFYHTGIGDWVAESGDYEILIGASSADIRLRKTVRIACTAKIRKRYDEFVTMGELMELPGAAPLLAALAGGQDNRPEDGQSHQKEAGTYVPADRTEDEDDEEIAMDYGAMGMDMPLIKVADMMQGAISDEMIEQVLTAVNSGAGAGSVPGPKTHGGEREGRTEDPERQEGGRDEKDNI